MPRKLPKIIFFIQSNARGYQVEYGLLRKGVEAELKGIQTVAVAVVRHDPRIYRRDLFHQLKQNTVKKFMRPFSCIKSKWLASVASITSSPTARPGKSPKAKLKNA